MSEENNNSKQNGIKMSQSLKNGIWSVINKMCKEFVIDEVTGYGDSTYRNRNDAELLWVNFFHKDIDEISFAGYYVQKVKSCYKALSSAQIVELVNFILLRYSAKTDENRSKFNKILEDNNAAFKIVNNILQPIVDVEVSDKIETAYKSAPTVIIRNHLRKAEEFYSDPSRPDYRSSCHESMCALEAALHYYFNNEDRLGSNINRLKTNKAHRTHNLHIIASLEKISAFRNDDTAHAEKKASYKINKEDAILIHTICCGFVYYFKDKNR